MHNNSLIDFLEGYASFFESMVATEQTKLDAVLSRSLKSLEQSISVKQAEAMKLENLEKQRLQLQKQLGYEGMTFSQIVANAPAQQKAEYQTLFDRVEQAVSQVKYLNNKSMELTSERVKKISGRQSGPQGVYGYPAQQKNEAPAPASMLETKI